MNYPHWWNETVTLFHRRLVRNTTTNLREVVWDKHIINNCFVSFSDRKTYDGSNVAESPYCLLRLPAGAYSLTSGDILFIGQTAETDPYILQGAIKASSAVLNDKLAMPHYRVEGDEYVR